jgi:transposase
LTKGVFFTHKHKHMKKYIVTLTAAEKKYLYQILSRGKHAARVITRARILLLTHDRATDRRISQLTGCSIDTVHQQRKRYHERSTIKEAIHDAPRPGQPPKLSPRHEAFIVATACTEEPPPGHAHWEPHGLKAALLEAYDDIQTIGNETIRRLLVRHKLKPWREKNVVRSHADTTVSGANGRSTHSLHRTATSRS